MTTDEIIEMAKEAGCMFPMENEFWGYTCEFSSFAELEEFVKLVAEAAASKEREECKKLCTWKTGNQFVDEAIAVCYRAIDQRGEA